MVSAIFQRLSPVAAALDTPLQAAQQRTFEPRKEIFAKEGSDSAAREVDGELCTVQMAPRGGWQPMNLPDFGVDGCHWNCEGWLFGWMIKP